MVKKSIFLAITLMVVGLAVVPQVQAQTRQQQQELEQIAKRSVNRLSPQDRQRVVQIMTDVFVAQGMSRQQAAALAETSADSMFSKDVGQMSAAERQQFAEQEQRLDYMNKPLNERIADGLRAAGKNPGWPPSRAFSRYGFTLKQPKDLGDPIFSWVEETDESGGPKLTIWIQAKGSFSLNANEMFFSETVLQKVEKLVASAAGTFDKNASNNSHSYYERTDPKRKNTANAKYFISTVVQPGRSAGGLVDITITLTTGEAHFGQ
jgi:hypothetical protein